VGASLPAAFLPPPSPLVLGNITAYPAAARLGTWSIMMADRSSQSLSEGRRNSPVLNPSGSSPSNNTAALPTTKQPPSASPCGSAAPAYHAEKRVALACHCCRSKRARCSGERPVCRKCAQVKAECVWPEGRKRKRTRKEMEMAERLAASEEALAAPAPDVNGRVTTARRPPQSVPTVGSGVGLGTGNGVGPAPGINDSSGGVPQSLVMSESGSMRPVRSAGGGSVSPGAYSPRNNMSPSPSASNLLLSSTVWEMPFLNTTTPYEWPPPQPFSSSLPTGSSNLPNQNTAQDAEQPSQAQPPDSATMLRVLESQVAIVDGDPSKNSNLELYYYRFVSLPQVLFIHGV
jgi:hypothetical protein